MTRYRRIQKEKGRRVTVEKEVVDKRRHRVSGREIERKKMKEREGEREEEKKSERYLVSRVVVSNGAGHVDKTKEAWL